VTGMPDVVLAAGLDAAQLAAIAALEAACAPDGRLKLEWPTLRNRPAAEVNDLLLVQGDEIVGFLGLYRFGRPLELTGMVHPAARRCGIGRRLLAAALALPIATAAEEVLLVADRASEAGAAFALAAGAVFAHAEHFMTLAAGGLPAVDRRGAGDVTLRRATEADLPFLSGGLEFSQRDLPPPGDDPASFVAVIEQGGEPVGTIRSERDAGGATILYGFEVVATRRGRGIGRAALRMTIEEVRRAGATAVSLEVLTDNERALGIYRDAGFETVTTMDYYRLAPAGDGRGAW
jgi:ribosomal protein S18 acetylase RimI-like enzyme